MFVKIISSVGIAAFVVMMGYVIDSQIWLIIIQMIFFNFFIGIFFISNNQYMMQVASIDARGMIGGCIQAFRETGFALGIAIINLC